MTFEERSKNLDYLMELTRSVMSSKGKEYSNSEDCLANFKRMGKWMGITPEKYAFLLVSKHLDWLNTFVQTKNEGAETLEDRIKDIFAYITIIYSICQEQKAEELESAIQLIVKDPSDCSK